MMLKITDQYSQTIKNPNIDTWALTNAPISQPPAKISARTLISAKLKPYNVTNMNSKARPNHVHPNQHSVYFNKDSNKKVYNLH